MSSLPSYVAAAKPVPVGPRPWYKTITPTYAGVMLWFVFWAEWSRGRHARRRAVGRLGPAFLGLIVAALICHFLYYVVPGMLGVKTGFPCTWWARRPTA